MTQGQNLKISMRDFTLKTFEKLLNELLQVGYGFVTFEEYIQNPDKKEKTIILRHDVDKNPLRSLHTAEMENELGIKGTYYFRIIKNELPKEVIARVAKLGHEIGYHYDDLNAADGIEEKALDLFQKNLAKLHELAPVKTACMHGSPLSRHDNKDLWKYFDYHEFGIIGEPYFDIDFSEVLYLTDTGRRWDGDNVSIRDKVRGNGLWVMGKREDRRQKTEGREQNKKSSRGAVCSPGGTDQSDPPKCADDWCCNPPAHRFHSTMDIIHALNENILPDKIILTIHPQRWNDNYLFWMKELIWQKIKNLVKYMKIKRMEKIGKK